MVGPASARPRLPQLRRPRPSKVGNRKVSKAGSTSTCEERRRAAAICGQRGRGGVGAAHRSRPLAWPVALSEIKAHKNGVFCGVIPFGHAPAAKRPRRDAELAGDVTHTDILIACANCGRTVPEADAKDAGWRYWWTGSAGCIRLSRLRRPRVQFRRPRLGVDVAAYVRPRGTSARRARAAGQAATTAADVPGLSAAKERRERRLNNWDSVRGGLLLLLRGQCHERVAACSLLCVLSPLLD